MHVNRLETGVLAGTYRPISPQDAINRRFNLVLHNERDVSEGVLEDEREQEVSRRQPKRVILARALRVRLARERGSTQAPSLLGLGGKEI